MDERDERIAQLEKERDAALKELSAVKVEGKVWTLARENAVPEHAIPDVANRARGMFAVVNGKLVHNDGTGFYTWLTGLKTTAPHLFEQAKAGGDATNGKRRSEMTVAEKAAYIGEHGQAKYFELPQ